MIKVKNITNPNNWRSINNQFDITTDEGNFFQSYSSIIVKIANDGTTFLDEYFWDYSRTTSRWRNVFLNETTKETKAKIKSGEYKLINLNG